MGQIKNIVAVIPARGGSKRIPRKNVRNFAGKPMISHSILAAKESEIFDHIYVSTEDEEIAQVAEKFGAEIITRPKELSDDHTPTIPVIRHSIDWINKKEVMVDALCCIYGCSPLVLPRDIIEGYKHLKEGNWEFVCSATEFEYPIQRGFEIHEDDSIEMLDEEKYPYRTQDLKPIFHDADKFYWGETRTWIEKSLIFSPRSAAVKIPRFRVQVIDNELDWNRAENIFYMLKKDNNKMKDKTDDILDKNNQEIKKSLNIIDEIENVRNQNNVNWMDILRLAYIHAPNDAKRLLGKINTMDNRISELLQQLSIDPNNPESN